MTSETMWAIDKHEQTPYTCCGLRYGRRRILRGLSNIILKRSKIVLNKSKINVLFVLFGGLGDLIINRNYILHLKALLNDESVEYYVTSDRDYETIVSLISSPDIHIIRLSEEYSFKHFDLIIRMIRYPVVVRVNPDVVSSNEHLSSYVQNNYHFQSENDKILKNHPYMDHQATIQCISQGKNRILQPDFMDNLDLENIIGYTICSDPISSIPYSIYQPYLTINRDSGWNSVSKLWPLDNYTKLVKMIKKEFPGIQIVAVGISMDESLRNLADLDLVGKTDMNQLKSVLDNSLLHIASEGFTVHLRHFMSSKPSIVFFGPTLESFYGYPENINFSSRDNSCWCEWKNANWYRGCAKGTRTCLEEITVEEVYESVRSRLFNIYSAR